ncbi:hypothetical protein PENSPDRAFT_758753 [Peniophora sp. CONT]|nr:hypothetical protein PENSPDRAFT_758753 [Peniophora sp. CONT]
MDEYARAAARVHAGLCALQAVPDALRANYSDEFTRELYNARTIRKKHGLPRMRYIAELTRMIAERCKPPGAYGLIPAAFAREVGKVELEPDVAYEGELGEYQWWQELHAHQWYLELDAMNGASESEADDDEVNTPPSSSPTDKLRIVDPLDAGSCRLRPVDLTTPEAEERRKTPEPNLYPLRLVSPDREQVDQVMVTEESEEAPQKELLPPVQLSTPPLVVANVEEDDEDDLLLIFPEDSAPTSCAPSRPRTPQLPTPPPSSAASFGDTISPSPQPTHKEPTPDRTPSPAYSPALIPASPILVSSRDPSPAPSDMALETPPSSPSAGTLPTPAPSRKRSASVAELGGGENEKQKTLKLEAIESVLGPLSSAKPTSAGTRMTLTASTPTPIPAPIPPSTPATPSSQKSTPVPVYYASPPSSSVAGPSRLPVNIPPRPQQVPVYRSPAHSLPLRPGFAPDASSGLPSSNFYSPQRAQSSNSAQNASNTAGAKSVYPPPESSSPPIASAPPTLLNNPSSPTDTRSESPTEPTKLGKRARKTLRKREAAEQAAQEHEAAVHEQQEATRQTMLDLSLAIATARTNNVGFGGMGFVPAVTSIGAATSTVKSTPALAVARTPSTPVAPAPAVKPLPTAPRATAGAPTGPRATAGAPTAPRAASGTPTAPRTTGGTPTASRTAVAIPSVPILAPAPPVAPSVNPAPVVPRAVPPPVAPKSAPVASKQAPVAPSASASSSSTPPTAKTSTPIFTAAPPAAATSSSTPSTVKTSTPIFTAPLPATPDPPRRSSWKGDSYRPDERMPAVWDRDSYRPDGSAPAVWERDSYRPDDSGTPAVWERDSYRPSASSSSSGGWTGDSYRPDVEVDTRRLSPSPPNSVPVYNATPSSSNLPPAPSKPIPSKPHEKPVCMADVQHPSCSSPLTPRALIAHLARAHGWDALRLSGAAEYICAGGGPGGMGIEREEFEKRVWDVVDGRVDLSEEGRKLRAQADSWRPVMDAGPSSSVPTPFMGDSYRPGQDQAHFTDDELPVCMAGARDRQAGCARLPPGAGVVWAHMLRAHGWGTLSKPGAREYICNGAPKRIEFERRVWDVVDARVDLSGAVEVKVKIERVEGMMMGDEESPVCMADPADRSYTCSLPMSPREVWAHMLSAHRWDALGPAGVAQYVCGGNNTNAWICRSVFESRVREVMGGHYVPVRQSKNAQRRGRRGGVGRHGHGGGLMAESMGGGGGY